MHWRNEREWALWEDRVIDGVSYNFTHLRSFDMPLLRPARGEWEEFRATVRVVFDCHVVTEGVEHIVRNHSAYWLDTGGKGRKFVPERYRYSLTLPDLLTALPTGKIKCYIAKRDNYMVWEEGEGEDKAHYQAFFDIYKPANQPADGSHLLILYVQSAYLKDDPYARQRKNEKVFAQLCAQLAGVIERKPKGPRVAINKKKNKR